MADATMPELLDTSDMICVHDAFRRALGDAPEQIASVKEGDTEQARRIASYLGEVLWFLHGHHEGEDELLYPLLVERAPGYDELFSRMSGQHRAVASGIETAERAGERYEQSCSAEDGEALSSECRALLDAVAPHLKEEEEEVLPIASRTITPAEWGALPAHVLSQYRGTRPWLLLGLVFEAMPEDMRNHVLANVPPPVSQMWFGFGADAFAKEMSAIRGTA
jgi:hemerythrin-like domain-containing protein